LTLGGDDIVCERICWDPTSVLVLSGLLDRSTLPDVRVETAREALDPSLPSNELVTRSSDRRR
jgi:carboxymethylenebutenolidase